MQGPIDVLDARILIVDDQVANLRLLEHVLRRGGYTSVTSTSEPVDVCELHRRNRFHIILLDIRMPRMDGFEVMRALVQVEGPRAAILVLSADPSQILHVLEAGATGFLSKPFDLADVLLRVRLLLEATMAGANLRPSAA